MGERELAISVLLVALSVVGYIVLLVLAAST